jgi:S-adenosylmethionine synthetase
VHLSYAIGMPDPTSVTIDCAGTEAVDEAGIERLVRQAFPLTPGGIIAYLGLRRPIFSSASYMARHIAKNLVAAGLAEECEVHLSYAIGMPDPTSVTIDCAGTEAVDEAGIERLVRQAFPLTPGGIIAYLGLRRPIFEPASYHGHFGRTPGEGGEGTFSWESTHRAAELAAACGAAPPTA